MARCGSDKQMGAPAYALRKAPQVKTSHIVLDPKETADTDSGKLAAKGHR